MLLGLLGALVAAFAYGAATIVQAVGVTRMKAAPEGASLLQRARAGWLYAVGLALDGLGFLASAGALRSLPLFLVQSIIAGSVALTAVLAVVVLKTRLSRREIGALVGVAIGLVMLALCAKEGAAHGIPNWLGVTLLVLAFALLPLVYVGYRARRSSVLALTAGLGFAGVAVAARILPWDGHFTHALTSASLWALLLHADIATLAYGLALDAGEATSVAAITFATETVVPAIIGLALLGDEIRAHTWPLALAGFVVTLASCIVLAGQSEPAASASSDPAAPASPEAPTS